MAEQPEEEDPFIRDTEDLVRSMETSSPSWSPNVNGGVSNNGSAGSYTAYTGSPQQGGSSSNGAAGLNQRPAAVNSSGSSYVKAGTSDRSPNGSSRRRKEEDEAVEMVAFEKGTSRIDLKDMAAVRRNGAS